MSSLTVVRAQLEDEMAAKMAENEKMLAEMSKVAVGVLAVGPRMMATFRVGRRSSRRRKRRSGCHASLPSLLASLLALTVGQAAAEGGSAQSEQKRREVRYETARRRNAHMISRRLSRIFSISTRTQSCPGRSVTSSLWAKRSISEIATVLER